MAQGSETGGDATLSARGGVPEGDVTLAGDAGASRTLVVPRAPAVGDVIGRYVVLDTIGRGGMGVVLAAYDPQLDRKVALKLVRPDRAADRGEIEREARIIAKLRHPNLVTVHDVGTTDAGVFLAMEFIEGVTLLEWSRSERSWREIVEVYLQAARGLAAAHESGVVHGDFKPNNVFVGTLGGAVDVKLLDFGLARGAGPEELPTGAPSSWIPAGTLAYMSPSRIRGGTPTAADDQFAFCVALFEALTGTRPYDLETLVSSSVLPASKVAPAWRSRVAAPPWLRALALRGVALDSSARYESMHEVVRALERGPGRARRRTFAVGGVATLGAAAVLVTTRPDPCANADAEIRGTWSAEIVDAASTDAELLQRVDARAAEYVGELSAAARRSCEMTRAGDLLLEARRTRCIDMGVSTLGVWAEARRSEDADMRRAVLVDAVGWEAPMTCNDDAALLHEPDPPPDIDRVQARDAMFRLTRATLSRYAVTFASSSAELDALVDELRGLGDPALLAEALYRRGQIANRAGKPEEGYELLLAALSSAEEAGATRLQVQIWKTIADNRNTVGDGEGLQALALERAAAGTARLGDPADLVADLHHARGVLANRRGDFVTAEAEMQRAIEVSEAAELMRPAIGARLSRVIVRLRADRIADAMDDGERAAVDAERAFGKEHPETALALGAYSAALSAAGRFQEARANVTRSLAILDAWGQFGTTSANGVACNWCTGVARVCRRDDAIEACGACIDRVLRADGVTLASSRGGSLGLNWLRLLAPEVAVVYARRVLEVANDSQAWARVRAMAAFVLYDVEPERALGIARELCPSPNAKTCFEAANLVIALHDPDLQHREHAVTAAIEAWRASSATSQSLSLQVGLALARGGHITREELSRAVAEAQEPCDPDRDAAVAWMAAGTK